jgi:cobalt-zinc-cadmium efflux system membrane fusion protein
MRKLFQYLVRTLFQSGLLLLAACAGKPSQEQQAVEPQPSNEQYVIHFTKEQYQTAGIELGKIESKVISGTILVNGVLDVPPQQMVSVSVPLGGFLKETPLLQGSRVRKGQVIATIENLEFIQLGQDYLEAKGQLEFARADYERQQALGKENVNSQKTLQQSKATFDSWHAKFSGLREKLKVMNMDIAALEAGTISSIINLRSPINGYVTEVNVNIGRYVSPTDILFEIVDTEHLHAELTIFEKDVPKIRIGQRVRFTLANESKERAATVFLIGRQISTDRTVRIHCHIDVEDTNLLPGMYLQAIIETGGAEVLALPDKAVIDYLGRKYLFYLDAGVSQSNLPNGIQYRFVMREVQVGKSEAGYTEVNLPPDLPSSAQVAVENAYALLSKLKNTEEAE